MEQMNMCDSPGLTVDIKKQRLRIYRNTFRTLNNPQYFRLLVNPESKGLVIEACNEKDVGSYHLTKIPTHKGSIELYSSELIQEIMACAGFSGLAPIKLYGHPIKEQLAMFFRLGAINSDIPEQQSRKGQSDE